MRKLIRKQVSILAIIFFISFNLSAQQRYVTHKVKKGETLTSIAKQYRVTPYSILQLNKDIKNSDDIQPNTDLVVLVEGKPVVEKKEEVKVVIESQAPIGFKKGIKPSITR